MKKQPITIYVAQFSLSRPGLVRVAVLDKPKNYHVVEHPEHIINWIYLIPGEKLPKDGSWRRCYRDEGEAREWLWQANQQHKTQLADQMRGATVGDLLIFPQRRPPTPLPDLITLYRRENVALRQVIENTIARLPAAPHHPANPYADLAFCWAQLHADVAVRHVYPELGRYEAETPLPQEKQYDDLSNS